MVEPPTVNENKLTTNKEESLQNEASLSVSCMEGEIQAASQEDEHIAVMEEELKLPDEKFGLFTNEYTPWETKEVACLLMEEEKKKTEAEKAKSGKYLYFIFVYVFISFIIFYFVLFRGRKEKGGK